MVLIRRAELKDTEIIVTLQDELINNQLKLLEENRSEHAADFIRKDNAKELFRKFVKDNISLPNTLILVAEVASIPAGYFVVSIIDNLPILKLEKICHIYDIYVRPEFQNKGISSMFLEKAIEWLKQKNITKIALQALNDNSRALAVYNKWSFTPFLIELRKNI